MRVRITPLVVLTVLSVFANSLIAMSAEAKNIYSEYNQQKELLFVLEKNRELYYPDDFNNIRDIGDYGEIFVLNASDNEPITIKKNSIGKEFILVKSNSTGFKVAIDIKNLRLLKKESNKKVAYINRKIAINDNGNIYVMKPGEAMPYELSDGKLILKKLINAAYDTNKHEFLKGNIQEINVHDLSLVTNREIILVDESKIKSKNRVFVVDTELLSRNNISCMNYDNLQYIDEISSNGTIGINSILNLSVSKADKSTVITDLSKIRFAKNISVLSILEDKKSILKLKVVKNTPCTPDSDLKTFYEFFVYNKKGVVDYLLLRAVEMNEKDNSISDYLRCNYIDSDESYFKLQKIVSDKIRSYTNSELNGEKDKVVFDILTFFYFRISERNKFESEKLGIN